MATLAELRTILNGELGVTDDAETEPWTTTVRNNAISAGYAALWRVGVWKDAVVDMPSVADAHTYGLSTIRRLGRLELLDDSLVRVSDLRGAIEPTGAGTGEAHLRLRFPIGAGSTLRAYGWTAYFSNFGQIDLATDDLPPEHNRIPLLKAKAILYRAQLGTFIRYGQKQNTAPEMNVTVDQFLGIIAATEREFAEEARVLSGLRPRIGQARRL